MERNHRSTSPRILVVDDHEADRALTLRVLASLETKATLAAVGDAVSFAEQLSRGPWDVVICEQSLAWADGRQVLAATTRRWPGCAGVLLTGASLDALAEDGEPWLCRAILRKSSNAWGRLPELVATLCCPVDPAASVAASSTREVADDPAPSPRPMTESAGDERAGEEPVASRDQEPASDPGADTIDFFTGVLGVDNGPARRPSLEGASELPGAPDVEADGDTAGSVHPLLPAVNLESALLAAMTDAKDRIRSTRARVRTGPLPTLYMRRDDAVALLRGLLEHAIDRAGGRRPVLTLHAQRRSGYWLLSLASNGIGPHPDELGEVVGRIRRGGVDHRPTTELGGCDAIVRRYGGDLWLHAAGDAGTTLYAAICARAADVADRVGLAVEFEGRPMGRIEVASLSDQQAIADAAMGLPALRRALDERPIRKVVFLDDDVVRVVA
ncbi:MAG: hypothetical protein H6983_15355 [Ectothiorhodospiraceae bacterium]|nr:hypothetical protein [Ectothiorhodospiraceae bacterium]